MTLASVVTSESLEAQAQTLWRGLPWLWEEELRVFLGYEASVGQEVTEEGLELWFGRVQAALCPVAGEGCKKPVRGRFCEFHRRQAEGRTYGILT